MRQHYSRPHWTLLGSHLLAFLGLLCTLTAPTTPIFADASPAYMSIPSHSTEASTVWMLEFSWTSAIARAISNATRWFPQGCLSFSVIDTPSCTNPGSTLSIYSGSRGEPFARLCPFQSSSCTQCMRGSSLQSFPSGITLKREPFLLCFRMSTKN